MELEFVRPKFALLLEVEGKLELGLDRPRFELLLEEEEDMVQGDNMVLESDRPKFE